MCLLEGSIYPQKYCVLVDFTFRATVLTRDYSKVNTKTDGQSRLLSDGPSAIKRELKNKYFNA